MSINLVLDPLRTPLEASLMLGRTRAALAQLRYRGVGPEWVRTGGLVRYRQSALDAWVTDPEG